MNLTNLMGMNSNRNLGKTARGKVVSSARLSTGKRINSAKDDAAGLAISQKMIGQIRGLNQADRNIADGMSVVNTMDGGMDGITEILQRQRELTVQAMNDTNTSEDKALIQDEIDELTKEITGMANRVQFNGMSLLNKPDYITDDEVFNQLQISTDNGNVQINATNNNGDTTNIFTILSREITIDGTKLKIPEDFSLSSTYVDVDANFTMFTYKYQQNGYNLTLDSLVANNNGEYVSISDILRKSSTSPDIDLKIEYTYSIGDLDCDHELNKNNTAFINNITNNKYNNIGVNGELLRVFNPSDVIKNPILLDNGNSYSLGYEGIYSKGSGVSADFIFSIYDPRTDEEKIPQEPFILQIGANAGQTMELTTYNCTAEKLGVSNLKTDPYESACKSLDDIDSAINKMSANRAQAGAEFNRLEYAQNSVQISSENLESSKSRILDADMAKEMMEVVKTGLLENVAISMLAQSNQHTSESVQQLLQ